MTFSFCTFFKIRKSGDFFEKKLIALPSFLSEKIKRFTKWQDAYASLFGKLLLIEGLKAFEIENSLNDLRFTKYGKPFLPDSLVCFSISHSGNCVICTVSDEFNRIGVDLEEIKPINIHEFSNIWTDQERDEIIKGGLDVFYEYWTRKEAILKADGRGLGIPLKDIDVCKAQILVKNETYYFKAVEIHNYKCNIASLKEIKDFKQIWVDFYK